MRDVRESSKEEVLMGMYENYVSTQVAQFRTVAKQTKQNVI